MTTPLLDRFRFMARAGQQTKTPIRAEQPGTKSADGTAVLRLYDPIDMDGGWWGVSGKEFAAALDELEDDVETIELHINSPGGSVWDGLAMMNALRQHPARVVAIVDGIAASAASVVMLGADEVVVAEGGEVMVHNAWGLAVGNAGVMRKMASDLEHEDRNLAGLYAAKAGGTADDWLTIMAEETWYTAIEAVDAGLADRVLTAKRDDSTEAKARFDLSVFAHAGRAAAPAPKTPATTSVSGSTEIPEESMTLTDAQVADLRTELGITDENADGDTILAALKEALTEQNDTNVPDGHVVIPAAQLADLQAGASAGTAASERLRVEDRKAFLDGVRTKYAPANRAAWEKEYDRDPEGTRAYFASAPDIVAVAPIGHDADPDGDGLDAELASLGFANLVTEPKGG